jgi:hypothetical protein
MDDHGCVETDKQYFWVYFLQLNDTLGQSWKVLEDRLGSATGNRTRV